LIPIEVTVSQAADASAHRAPPFQLARLDHVVIRARDSSVLVRFYCDVLGCQVEREVTAVGLIQLRAGDSLIDVVSTSGELGRSKGAPPEPEGGHNLDHFCLRVDPFEVQALTEHLRRCGVTSSRVRDVYGAEGIGPSIYIEDPEGNQIELKGPAVEPARRALPKSP
jgi:catechol 2,3-dioxygenase-like lactoylglutathione lyase family enzyme